MSHEDDSDELERLFWGLIKPFNSQLEQPFKMVPEEVESTSMPRALAHTQAIIYRREAAAVRAALGRIEAGLMNELEAPGGQVSLSEYNLRITRIIRAELEGYNRRAADVERILREMK